MNRTQRLEAALRNLVGWAESVQKRVGVRMGDANTGALVAAQEALADTSPSCCEEVRRATLEEAAAEGKFLIPCDDRYDAGVRALAKRIRALSNQPPPFCDQPSPSGVARCELEPQHEGKHAGNAKEGNLVFWGQAPNQAPPKSQTESGPELLEEYPRTLWPDGPGGGPYLAHERERQREHIRAVVEQRERLNLPPFQWEHGPFLRGINIERATKSVTVPILPVDDAAEARIKKLLEEKRAPLVCPTCGGNRIVPNVRRVPKYRPCPACTGRAKQAPPVCPTCDGSGYVLTKGSAWRTGSGEEAGTFGGKASCPDCAGGVKR